MDKTYGLALEGGGAKGSYHIGAIKAIIECGFNIGAVVGTSIGSFNAAIYAQGDFNKLYDLWYNGSASLVIELNEGELKKARSKKIDLASIKYWANFITSNLSNKGIDTEKLKKLYNSYVDEKRLRESKIDFGMVTVSITDRKPINIYKENMEEGKVTEYLLASSYLPVFKKEKIIDNKRYIDGGVYDNCPLTLLINRNYKDIIEVRTKAIGIPKKVDRKNLNIYTILPSKDTGSILFSDNSVIRQNIKMGYFDAMRVFKGYIGLKYYVIPIDDNKIFESIINLSDIQIKTILGNIKIFGASKIEQPKKILLEKIIPYICGKINSDTSTYQKMIVSIIEEVVDETILPIYKLYAFDDILKNVKKEIPRLLKKEEKKLIQNNTKELMLRFLREI